VANWIWIPALGLYQDTESGRYAGPNDILDDAWESIELGKDTVAGMADALIDGTIDLGDWQEAMRQQIMDEYTRQYLAGVGGEGEMKDRDWDRLNDLIEEQYAYLDNFAEEIGDGLLSPGQIEVRAKMYVDSAQQAYWAGVQSAKEMPALPALPGDGSTRCMCITTPAVPVLTRRGWVPMLDVQVGDEVWTHRARWRPVTGIVVKPAGDNHRQAWLGTPTGHAVGCTEGHLWYVGGNLWLQAAKVAFAPTLIADVGDGPYRYDCISHCEPGNLPPEKEVWDLTVAEDHSFVIGGLVAHNTNCRCEWVIEDTEDGWDCTWVMDPAAEHCFPAGTMIAVPGGVRAIESFRVGDAVLSSGGPARVTKIYCRPYAKKLITVEAGRMKVQCTDNHPFRTQRGWVRADALRGNDAVLLQEGNKFVFAQVAFPDASNNVPACRQVSISASILVYNLEVEAVHEYIANGFVVHNCPDCEDRARDWNPLAIQAE